MSKERSHDGEAYDLGAATSASTETEHDAPLRRLKVTKASEVVMRRLRWLWDLRIVLGGLTLLAGREGIGKSTVAVWLAAAVTRGLLDGEHKGDPRTVVYVNSEDARDYTIVPRLKAAGADLEKVIFVDAVMPGEKGEEYTESIVLPKDADLLAALVREHDGALVILDAATSVIDSKLDGDKDRQMRQGLEAIGRVVGEGTGAAVLGIVHFGKRDSNDTGKLILGSIAWSQVARAVLAVALDEENGSLVLTRSKGNLGKEPPSLEVQIVSATVPTSDGVTSVGRAELIGETERDARTLLGTSELDEAARSELDEAEEWLRDYLTSYSLMHQDKGLEWPLSADVKKAARAEDISPRTLARARKNLGVDSRPVTDSDGKQVFPRRTYWALPDVVPDSTVKPSGAKPSEDSLLCQPPGTTGEEGSDQQVSDPEEGSQPLLCQPHVHEPTDGTAGTTGDDLGFSSRANGTTAGTTATEGGKDAALCANCGERPRGHGSTVCQPCFNFPEKYRRPAAS